ncbi:Ataxin-2-like protein [Diplonema papillatum]|nr:Ataxin-2-like protein [Diplonema papillatum]
MPEGMADGDGKGAERIMWLWSNLVGQTVLVTVRDGQIWEGLFESKEDASMTVVLSCARLKASDTNERTSKTSQKSTLTIPSSDIVFVLAQDAHLAENAVQGIQQHGTALDKNRELVPYNFDKSGATFGYELEDQPRQNGTKWNQFQANEELYGVKSSYDEKHYTTSLDYHTFSPEQIAKAAKMAAEIEAAGGGKHDMATWADDFDEEAKHSCVPRESDQVSMDQLKSAGKQYVPPHLRSSMDARQPAAPRPAAPRPAAASPASAAPMAHDNMMHHQQQQQQQQQPPPAYERDGSLQLRADGSGRPVGIPSEYYNDEAAAAPHSQPAPLAAQSMPRPLAAQAGQSPPPPPQQQQPASQPPVSPSAAQQQQQPPPPPAAAAAALAAQPQSAMRTSALQNLSMHRRPGAVRTKMSLMPQQQPSQSKADVIASFRNASVSLTDKLNQRKTPKPETAAPLAPQPDTPQQAPETPEGLDTPQKKKLNPAAQPFVMQSSQSHDDEDSKTGKEPTTPEKSEGREPFPEPVWKPALSEKAQETQFICKVIANGIFHRMTKQAKGGSPMPIPGDPDLFSHEWKGDDYYWDEEYESDDAGGHRQANESYNNGTPYPGAYHQHHQHHTHHQHSVQHQHHEQHMHGMGMQHQDSSQMPPRNQGYPQQYGGFQQPPQQQWQGNQPSQQFQQHSWQHSSQPGQYQSPNQGYQQPQQYQQHPMHHQQQPPHQQQHLYQQPQGQHSMAGGPPMRSGGYQNYPSQHSNFPSQPSQVPSHMQHQSSHYQDPNLHMQQGMQGHLPSSSMGYPHQHMQHRQQQQPQYGQMGVSDQGHHGGDQVMQQGSYPMQSQQMPPGMQQQGMMNQQRKLAPGQRR